MQIINGAKVNDNDGHAEIAKPCNMKRFCLQKWYIVYLKGCSVLRRRWQQVATISMNVNKNTNWQLDLRQSDNG